MAPSIPRAPDYKRLCVLSERIQDLNPDEIMAIGQFQTAAAELSALLQESLNRYGISEGRLRVLANLFANGDEPSTHTQLAEDTGVTKATITGLIDGLEKDGLVRRFRSPEDRRVSLVELTPDGETMLHGILPGHLAWISEILGSLDQGERTQLIHLLEKIRAGWQPHLRRGGLISGESP